MDSKKINNVPTHWQVKKLGEIFTIERGGSPRPIEDFITNSENGINWIKIGDTKDIVKYIYKTKEKIKPEGAKRSRIVFEDDFLLSNSMSFGRPYIMKTTGCIHDGWLVIRKNEIIDNNYLYYILGSSQVYQQFLNLAKGSTVKNLNIEAVKQVVIKFPPLPEQLAIVSCIEELLSDLENGKQQLLTAQQQLKVYRQSLLKWAFEGKLTNKDIKVEELPKGWKWVKLGDVCHKIGDIDHKMPKNLPIGYPYVSTKDFTDDLKISFKNVKYISKEDYLNLSKKIKPEKGDIIFPRYGTIGKNILVDFDKEFLVSYSCAVVKPNLNMVLSKYVYLYTLSPKITEEIRKYTVETTQANVGIASIKCFIFPLPPLSEQQNIVDELESKLTVCDKIVETISHSLQQAETLRQSILMKAFEGKLVKII